jgi:Uma2 family endonuclease
VKNERNEAIHGDDQVDGIHGRSLVTEKISEAHSQAVQKIATAFQKSVAVTSGKEQVFSENVLLYCNERDRDEENRFSPDLMVVRNDEDIKDDGVHSVPIFVAEITTMASRRIDYGEKMLTYLEIGVDEYWVVDLDRKVVMRYLLSEDYAPEAFAYPSYEGLAVYTHPLVEIDLAQVFGTIV